MRKLRLLVSAVGGDLGQGVIRCLRESSYQATLLGCDMNPHAAGRMDVDGFYHAPPVKDGQKYGDFLLGTIRDEKIDYVFLTSEPEIFFVSRNQSLFEPHENKFILHDSDVIETFGDKYLTVMFCENKGIPVPRTFLKGDYHDQLSFPVVVKRRRGSGSQNLHVVRNPRQLDLALMEPHEMVVQEYLPGENNEFTAAIFKTGDAHHRIAFRRILGRGGYSQQAELVSDPEIHGFLDLVASRIDFTGSINIQFKVIENRGCVPFEINPRFSSTAYIRHVFGFRDVQWWLDIREGNRVVFSRKYSAGIAVRRMSEVFFDLK